MGGQDVPKSETQKTKSSKLFTYVLLHALIVLYSLSAVCSKCAAQYEFLSIGFFLWYAGVICLLGIYALGWQQVLKRLPLTTAYVNKGITIVWGFLWGALIFSETISLKMYIGAAIVFVGIILVVISNE